MTDNFKLSTLPAGLPVDALDDRLAIVGTSGSGKTYAAKGLVERLLRTNARLAIVDPLGVWWGLRAGADGIAPGFPVIVLGGRHADVPITAEMGAPIGGLVADHAFACVVDVSELGSGAARRRFMSAFAEALYERNREPLHLVLDEADLWAPQRPLPDQTGLLGRIEEIVRRGRVRGFIPWLITQRPAVIHKDVLSQADILIAMKLTASQDRDAIGAWIEGQADRTEGKRILAALPRLRRGEGYLWAPGHDVLQQVAFPPIGTFDSSRAPRRGERIAGPAALAKVDVTAIAAALHVAARSPLDAPPSSVAETEVVKSLTLQLGVMRVGLAQMTAQRDALAARLAEIAAIAAIAGGGDRAERSVPAAAPTSAAAPGAVPRQREGMAKPEGQGLHPAGRKLLQALAQHAPGRFTWGQVCTLAGLKPSGGHFNAGRKSLRDGNLVEETGGLVGATAAGMGAAGQVSPAPSTPTERLAMWCARLPSPAPEMLRTLAERGASFMDTTDLARQLGKRPSGGHWNSGMSVLRNNGLIEGDGKRWRAAELLRSAGRSP